MLAMDGKERWKPVAGYEGSYSVSNLGRVRSEPRRVQNNAAGGMRLVRERIIKQRAVQGGYLCVWLCLPGEKHRVFKVADLVLAAFRGPKPSGKEVLHGPAGKTDNSLANLRYGTKRENAADAIAHGTQVRGERHGNAKLSDAQAERIRLDPRPSIVIAIEAGISYAHVRALKTGRRRIVPLDKSPTRGAIGRNIKTERAAGKPKAQAVAIALNTARNAGLDIPQKDQPRQSSPVPKPSGNSPRSGPKSSKTKPAVPKGNGTPPKGLR